MTHFVTDKCINCKYTSCVEVCPVDCFYEGFNMLVIHPDECIDCGVCIPECPVEAIVTDIEIDPNMPDEAYREKLLFWLGFNRDKVEKDKWPKISHTKDPMPEAEEFKNIENKKEYLIDKGPEV